jgi:hypothetical protein
MLLIFMNLGSVAGWPIIARLFQAEFFLLCADLRDFRIAATLGDLRLHKTAQRSVSAP